MEQTYQHYNEKNNPFKKAIIFIGLLITILTLPSFSQTIEKTSEPSAYNILSSDGFGNDTISLSQFPDFVQPLEGLFIKSTAKMLFSGAGFSNAVAISFSRKFHLPEELKTKITRGTKITFENCLLTNENGVAVKTIHKSILIKSY